MYAEQSLGKYQLIAEIARGGMGIVYLALVQGPGGFSKLVVIKELKVELAEDPSFLTMFLDEARLAARLNHPSIVQTNEVGSEGNRHFMAMDYLDGRTYERVRRRSKNAGNTFTLPMQLKVFCDVLGALDYAHEIADFDGKRLAVVHRDVSPNNVFVTFDGHIKVLDFGIAKAADHNHETVAGAVKGKLSYMAPEQARGKAVDARADVFSVGVMLWEAIAGKRLRSGGQDELVGMVAGEEPPRVSTVVPDVAPTLDAIVAKALANDPDARYASAGDMLLALETFLASIGGPPSARELAAVVTKLFAEERTKVNTLIETHLKAARSNAAGASTALASDLPVIEMTGAGRTAHTPTPTPKRNSASLVPMPTPTAAGESLDFAARSPAPPAPPRSRTVLITISAVAAIAIGAVVMITARGEDRPVRSAEAPQAPTALPGAGEPPTVTLTPEPAGVELVIQVTPATATIAIDDAEVAGNPFRGRYRMDGLMHRIRASAPGFEDSMRDVSFSGNIQLQLELKREPKGQPSASRRVQRAPNPRVRPAERLPSPPSPTTSLPPVGPPPPVVQPTTTPTAPATDQINPNGGQRPRRTIDSKNPYGTP